MMNEKEAQVRLPLFFKESNNSQIKQNKTSEAADFLSSTHADNRILVYQFFA